MYKIILAVRYLVRRPIAYLAVLAVALCVFIVVVVMTVLTGLVIDFKQKNHRFVGDCVVGTESLVGFAYYEDFVKRLQEADFVESTSVVIRSYALISPVGGERNIGVEIMGIDPRAHIKATGWGETLYYNRAAPWKAFEQSYEPNVPGCVVGIDLLLMRDAKGGYVHGATVSEIPLAVTCFPLTAKGALALAGTGLVRTKTFCVSDTAHSGLARVDTSIIYVPFEQAQLLCMSGAAKRASAIHIKFKPGIKIEEGRQKVSALWQRFKQEKAGEAQAYLLDTVAVRSWKEDRRAFIAAMEKEQTMMTAMFGLVGVTTVFIVFVVFYMIVSHKSKDIGILKSLGVSNFNLVQVYFGFAILVGMLGSALGAAGGWMFLAYINPIERWLFEHFDFQLWDRSIFAIGDIPNQIELSVLAAIILSAIFACLAGALVPSWQAARVRPVETLQVSQL
jgi:lipoprotein-releasing system permease protein